MLSTFVYESGIQGIYLAGREIIISQLADDTTVFLKDDSQILIVFDSIEVFSKASGLKLNFNKM